jgi:hypothetical protein
MYSMAINRGYRGKTCMSAAVGCARFCFQGVVSLPMKVDFGAKKWKMVL